MEDQRRRKERLNAYLIGLLTGMVLVALMKLSKLATS
jgi:hypothetical protein